MKLRINIILFSALLLTGCAQQNSVTPTNTEPNLASQTYQVGVMVEAISFALSKPNEASSLETISLYGTDSRYYVMIRGWLVQEQAGVQSQLDAIRSSGATTAEQAQTKQKFIDKLAFLTLAIRRIDLE